jgi:hypothetical protein
MTTATDIEFKFRLQWSGTALTVKILAKDLAQAEKRLTRQLKKMDGGDRVIEIIHVA